MPRGNSDSTLEALKPDVTTIVPSVTRRPPSTKSRSRSRGFPTSGFTTPAAPAGMIWAATPLDASVSKVASAVPPVTRVTLPAKPPTGPRSDGLLAAAITG